MTHAQRLSLALFLLPHAGLDAARYVAARRALLLLLAPHGDPRPVAIASEISPRAVRRTIAELLGCEPATEVAA